jgi:predicted metal-dependent hydrolase
MTKKGSINLNVNLLKAPEDVIDYIILHELCHLKIKEHSHHYWDYVRR